MFENPRRGRQARNFTTNVPKILDLKSSSEQIFSRKLPLGAPEQYNTRPINERARGHTKNFVMTLTDFSRREKSSRESMQGGKGALCWVICSCMKHFTANPEHYKCLLQATSTELYTYVLSNTYMLVSKFRDTAPILGERNIVYTVAASGALGCIYQL